MLKDFIIKDIKVRCECGSYVSNYKRHIKRTKHKKFLESNVIYDRHSSYKRDIMKIINTPVLTKNDFIITVTNEDNELVESHFIKKKD